MKALNIIIIGATIALSSCSSAYRTEQTPDDVYYSPGQQAARSSNSATSSNGEYYNANPNDQYLMMKVQDPTRWSTFDEYGYDGFYSPYNSFGYGAGYYSAFSPWMTFGYWNPYYSYMNSYYMWNSFYNPYYYGIIVVSPKYPSYYNAYAGLHPFNVNAYRNGINSNVNSGRFYTPTRPNNSFINRNSYNRPFSNQGSNNNNIRTFSQPTRSYTPSSFGNGGGSRGGGGGGFSRPGKG
ncbi:MAG TPA: hypothetical protein VNV85_11180 [Puia sp.]|jgi:hypothetical protein|nr:hypothetical protein [Puia sp.]